MSSEAVTREDLKNVLNTIFPPKTEEDFIIKRLDISSRTYTANAAYWTYTPLGEFLPKITGYTPVGYLGGACNSGGLVFALQVRPNDYHLYGMIRNVTSSAITIDVVVYILYARDGIWRQE